MVFDPRRFNKADTIPGVETKNVTNNSGPEPLSFPEYLVRGGHGDLSAYASILLYMQAMPLFNAVSLRAESLSLIPMRVLDVKTRKYVDDHESLELLNRPNADVSGSEFLEQVSSYYDITGDSFLVSTGDFNKPPLELASVPPQSTLFGPGGNFGILHVPDYIGITQSGYSEIKFKAKDIVDRGIRFLNTDRGDKELWHMRTFNPLRSSNNFRGLSKARPVWFEIQQYISGNNSNLSLLKRGTKLSLAWVNNRNEELTDKQWERMQEEAAKYSGDLNSGGTPVLDGMDVKSIQQTNRDMEFKDLQESMLSRISSNYRIPLALLLSQSMTLNNLETSMYQLFDNAIIPLRTRVNDELTRFLMPRYKNSENLVYAVNENDIGPLQSRIIDRADKLKKINSVTDDEIRTVLGYDPLPEGGDVIWRPSGLLPGGFLDFSSEELSKPIDSKFKELLVDRGYSWEEAQKIADHSGI